MRMKKLLSAALSLAIAVAASEYYFIRSSVLSGGGQTAYAYNEGAENPYNKQDDKIVEYDGKKWVQPANWNEPRIDPRDYTGGVMLFLDKIGLEPEYARGKVQRVYFSAVGIQEPVNMVRFHMFYDTRLKVKVNSDGKPVTNGNVFKDFTTDSVMVEEGQIEYYAYSDTAVSGKGSIFTVDFIVPENAGPGEVYPFGIEFVEDKVGPDLFINKAQDEAGKIQMTYVFTKGLHSGYIRTHGEKPKPPPMFGDPNDDGRVDAKDATFVLKEYALRSTNVEAEPLPTEIKNAADVNLDGFVDARDASTILAYYAYLSTGGKDELEVYLGYVGLTFPIP